jgi:hypothetical protein
MHLPKNQGAHQTRDGSLCVQELFRSLSHSVCLVSGLSGGREIDRSTVGTAGNSVNLADEILSGDAALHHSAQTLAGALVEDRPSVVTSNRNSTAQTNKLLGVAMVSGWRRHR